MLGIEVDELLVGELAAQEKGRILAPGRIYDWLGEYPDGSPKILHLGRSAQTEVFMTAYLKAASISPPGDYRWIPVLLEKIETIVNGWEGRRETMGDIAETVDRCCRHETFRLIIYQGEQHVVPTLKGIKFMTDAGRLLIP